MKCIKIHELDSVAVAVEPIKVGETVTVETELFDIQNGNETLGYQIINNNAYIDPLSLMEIYG